MPDELTILVIDDDEVDRLAVRRACKKSELTIKISEAENEQTALHMLEKNTYDCILLDCRLGGTEGLHLLQQIVTKDLSRAPVIMLSGVTDDTHMLQCLKDGAQDYLLKSELSTSILTRAIRYALERIRITEELRYVAQHDSLTGLANRALFLSSVRRSVSRSQRNDELLAILFIDLDNFKTVNDSLGHDAGDELLVTFAKRLHFSVRDGDLVGRLGGDEFAVLMEEIPDQTSLIAIAQHIIDVTGIPIKAANRDLQVTISLGIATFPDCAKEASELVKCADLAMYSAKQDGRNCYKFYSSDLQQLANDYAVLKNDLRIALNEDQFELFYQPQVDAKTRNIIGVEALIRWNHPTRGRVPPDDFIEVAERTGLIKDIGKWVIKRACKEYRELFGEGAPSQLKLVLALNVSANQLRQQDLVEFICGTAIEEGISLNQLEVELTEHAVIQNIELGARTLEQLVERGVRVAIDDFGTGYASLKHLQQLPIQTLKIDRTFVMNLPEDKTSLEIVKAIIAMAKAMNLQIVAEGVETKAQADILTQLDCTTLQGYFFGRPQPIHALRDQIIAINKMISTDCF